MNLTYLRYEILRVFRNRRFFIFALVFPFIIYLLEASQNQPNYEGTGISLATYLMVGLAGFGSMAASISGGARIATERQAGWNRQLRLTPLSPRAYFRAKIITGYLMAALSIALLFAAGIAHGVHLSPGEWATLTLLMLVALAPFCALGIMAGHLLTPESIGPAMGGGIGVLALLGGAFGAITNKGVLLDIIKLLPSYWLSQSGVVALEHKSWPAEGWLVIAAWTVALAVIARWAYRRDTKRV